MSNIWDEVLARIDVKINRHSYNTWFKPTTYVGDQGTTIVVRVPNALFSDWLNKHYSAVLNEALSDLGRTGTAISFVAEGQAPPPERTPVPEPPVVAGSRRADRAPWRVGPGPRHRAGGSQSPLHLRDLRRRVVEPVRARGVARGSRSAVALVQPAVHVRRRGPWQDALDARGRTLRPAAQPVVQAHLHLVRAVHERDDQRGAVRPDPRFPRTLPIGRRAARRRRAVPGGQGRHADRVLPHVQRAVRLAEADRHQQRLSAARDSAARRAPSIAVRVGSDRGHPAARSRDKSRDFEEKGGSRRGAAARQRRDLHRGENQVEHPRARGIADAPGRVCVAHELGDLARRSRRTC